MSSMLPSSLTPTDPGMPSRSPLLRAWATFYLYLWFAMVPLTLTLTFRSPRFPRYPPVGHSREHTLDILLSILRFRVLRRPPLRPPLLVLVIARAL
jgi:hypothetical protein